MQENEQKVSKEDLSAIQATTMKEANKIVEGFTCYASTSWFTIPKEVFNVCSPEASILYGNLLGFSSGLYRGSNTALARLMNCSTRTIARLLNELKEKQCIRVVIVNRSTRLLYPVYTLPFIMDIEPKEEKKQVAKRSSTKEDQNACNDNGVLTKSGFEGMDNL